MRLYCFNDISRLADAACFLRVVHKILHSPSDKPFSICSKRIRTIVRSMLQPIITDCNDTLPTRAILIVINSNQYYQLSSCSFSRFLAFLHVPRGGGRPRKMEPASHLQDCSHLDSIHFTSSKGRCGLIPPCKPIASYTSSLVPSHLIIPSHLFHPLSLRSSQPSPSTCFHLSYLSPLTLPLSLQPSSPSPPLKQPLAIALPGLPVL